MSVEFPNEPVEPIQDPPRWWREAIFPFVILAWVTFSFFLPPRGEHGWSLLVAWLLYFGYVDWLYWRHTKDVDRAPNQ